MPQRPPSSAQAAASARLLRAAVASLAGRLPLLHDLGGRFAAAGYEVALVGGPVRDAFLGRVAPDLDLATDARPDGILEVIAGWADARWEIGREFGTIGMRKGDVVIDVTTYRCDRYDRLSRKPDVAFGSSLVEDLGRRDFTVNAMAMRLPSLEFVDAFDGLGDLAARVLRTPAAPEESFADDPLRMMRAARFASTLGFAVAPEVYAAMSAQASTLRMVSAERVRDELTKLLLADSPREGLRLLVDSGLAGVFLPELPALRLEVDEHHRHKDVYEHSLTVLEQAIALEGRAGVERPDLVLRLAALLHDVGKPSTRRFESAGGVSFHHHETVGARLVAKRLKALRYDKDAVSAVARLVELHLRFHGYGQGQWTDSAVRRYVTDAGPLLGRLHLLTRSDCTTRNTRKATQLARAYDELEERIARLSANEELAAVRPGLNGHEIGQVLGIAPGPVLGEAYRYLLSVRLDEGPIGKPAVEARLRDWWAARGEPPTQADAEPPRPTAAREPGDRR
ncbi:MAG: CCA tRNA nucleotidyltransferase [Dermatophilaceae bacterium]